MFFESEEVLRRILAARLANGNADAAESDGQLAVLDQVSGYRQQALADSGVADIQPPHTTVEVAFDTGNEIVVYTRRSYNKAQLQKGPISDALGRFRSHAGLTQSAIAARMDISHAAVNKLENPQNTAVPKQATLLGYAVDGLGYNVEDVRTQFLLAMAREKNQKR